MKSTGAKKKIQIKGGKQGEKGGTIKNQIEKGRKDNKKLKHKKGE
jgi:hypothetical protein